MTKNQHLNGGDRKSAEPFDSDKIEFPVSFVLKLVMTSDKNKAGQKDRITALLNRMNVVHLFQEEKPSAKGNYLSYSILVTLIDQAQMKGMYEALKLLPDIKMAI